MKNAPNDGGLRVCMGPCFDVVFSILLLRKSRKKKNKRKEEEGLRVLVSRKWQGS